MQGPVIPDLPRRVTIREVGPRDGLQAAKPLPVEARARLITYLSRMGIPKIEAVSFVSPQAVPAMAGAAEVWARVERSPDVQYSALVPNRRGAESAAEAGGFSSLQAFLAASDGYNRHNVGKGVRESVRDVQAVAEVGREAGLPVECSISSAFGDPFDGDVPPSRVVEVATWVVDAGVEAVSLGDTVGVATPARVWATVQELRDALPELLLNLHFHDTRGAGMANVLAALELGCDEFDGSVGGIGGSPFAPGAAGNVATEELVDMLGDMGIETSVHSVEGLIEIAQYLESLLGRPLPSRVMRAGSRPRPGAAQG